MSDTHSTDTTMANAFAQAGFDFDATAAIDTADHGDDDGPRAQSRPPSSASRPGSTARLLSATSSTPATSGTRTARSAQSA